MNEDFDIKQSQILIIEDDREILKFLKIHFNRFFSNISISSDSREALKLIKSKPFDLVISDIVMPNLNGLKLLKEIRITKKEMPVILMSGYANESNRRNARKLDIDEIFEKPLDLKKLFIAIRTELEHSKLADVAESLLKGEEPRVE